MKPQVSRSAFCNVTGCGQPSAFFPIIKVWAKGYPKTSEPLRCEVGMGFCHAHKNFFRIDDVPNLCELFCLVAAAYEKCEPDWSTATVEIVPITA